MIKGIKYMVLLTLLCIFSCTTEVDICMEDSHLHLAEVNLRYNTDNIPVEEQDALPDSMMVVAYRVVRSWKCTYVAPTAQDAGLGRYVYNKPYQDVTEVRGLSAATRNSTEGEPLYVKRGEYRFITFNNTLNDAMFATGANSRWFETDGMIDDVIANRQIELYYKGFERKAVQYGRSWLDFNPYTTYIGRCDAPVYFNISDMYELEDSKKNDVTLNLEKKTQDFEIRFRIERDSVIVDSIIAEVSGIACGMHMITGKYDFTKTYKLLFKMSDITEPTDNEWYGISTFSKDISVMALVASNSKELDTGPGILQLAIYTHTFNNSGKKKTKVFRVGINMYNTMRKYGYVLAGQDEKILLEIEQVLTIDKDEIIKSDETDSSLDYWIIRDDIHVDI